MRLPELVKLVGLQLDNDEKGYLVGGAVRDLVLDRDAQDYDFAISRDPRRIARKIADILKGAFYVMDPLRSTCRVIYQGENNSQRVLDFSILQGNIVHDLQKRDFTINSMAIDLLDPERIIDPLKGGRDLQEKWLRPTNQSSFEDDPVRVIRVARYATELGLRIEPATLRLIEKSVGSLVRVSLERKRDELFKILDSANSIQGILLLQKLGVVDHLDLDIQGEISSQFRAFEIMERILFTKRSEKDSGFLFAESMFSFITLINEPLRSHCLARNSNGHSRLQLDKFFLINNPNSPHNSRLTGVFSKDELDHIEVIKRHEPLTMALLQSSEEINHLDCYQFFKQAGKTGVDLILVSLAKIAGKPASEIDQKQWLNVISKSVQIIDIWFNHPEVSSPTPLITGDEILEIFGIQPGPIVGKLINGLIIAQASGTVRDRDTAVNFLCEIMKKNPA